MSDPFLGEVRMLSFNYAPRGWAQCNGQLLPINQNTALFSLLGTMYGGNGTINFALPDLRGRAPIHIGGGHTQGESAGEATHTLTQSELPQHTHTAQSSNIGGTTGAPTNNLLANFLNGYSPATNLTTLSPGEITSTGGSQPHQNLQPYLTINFSIALSGIFPSRN